MTGRHEKLGDKEGCPNIHIQVERTLYVPHIAHSELKKELQKREDSLLKGKISDRVKILEKLGPTFKD